MPIWAMTDPGPSRRRGGAGRDHNDPLFLQVKEAQESALERFVGQSTYPHHGQRV